MNLGLSFYLVLVWVSGGRRKERDGSEEIVPWPDLAQGSTGPLSGDTRPDGSIAKPWRLCTVQQVEDLKALIRILPIWSSGILVSVSVTIQDSLTVLQALTMDRSLGPSRFSIPTGFVPVSAVSVTVLFISFLDRLLFPLWHCLTGHNPTPLQRIGLGQLIIAAAMAVFALVETRRASIVRSHHAEGRAGVVPMSALWLVLPMVVTGTGEALHFLGKVSLFYQEFLATLRNTSGMAACTVLSDLSTL